MGRVTLSTSQGVKESLSFVGQPTAFFLSFAVEFFSWSWLLLLLFKKKKKKKKEELFFFSEKLLSFLPLFFGASFTHKKSPFIRYTIIVYETRADIYLYVTHAFL